MESSTTAKQALEAVKGKLKKNPGIILEGLCEGNNATMAELLECLPDEMWKKIDGKFFTEVLEEISGWGKVTTIVHTADVIMEFSGPMPAGEESHGYYNLSGEGALHGHLRPKRCGAIYFIKRPFMGKVSASIQFININGGVMFKVYLGRNEQKEIFPHQLEAFHALSLSKQTEAEMA